MSVQSMETYLTLVGVNHNAKMISHHYIAINRYLTQKEKQEKKLHEQLHALIDRETEIEELGMLQELTQFLQPTKCNTCLFCVLFDTCIRITNSNTSKMLELVNSNTLSHPIPINRLLEYPNLHKYLERPTCYGKYNEFRSILHHLTRMRYYMGSMIQYIESHSLKENTIKAPVLLFSEYLIELFNLSE